MSSLCLGHTWLVRAARPPPSTPDLPLSLLPGEHRTHILCHLPSKHCIPVQATGQVSVSMLVHWFGNRCEWASAAAGHHLLHTCHL